LYPFFPAPGEASVPKQPIFFYGNSAFLEENLVLKYDMVRDCLGRDYEYISPS